MKQSGIYGIFNTTDSKVLVGSTQDLQGRWYCHRWCAGRNRHGNPHFQNAWNRDGEKSFEFRILELCPIGDLLPREDYWMSFYKSLNPSFGYNLKTAERRVMSEETVEKLRRINTGKKRTPETKALLSASKIGEKNPFFGKTHTPENRKVMSEASKRRINRSHIPNEETRRKMSLAHKGRQVSEETRKRNSDSQKLRHRLHPMSAETRRKNGLLHRMWRASDETKKKMSLARKAYLARLAKEAAL